MYICVYNQYKFKLLYDGCIIRFNKMFVCGLGVHACVYMYNVCVYMFVICVIALAPHTPSSPYHTLLPSSHPSLVCSRVLPYNEYQAEPTEAGQCLIQCGPQ